ncbi:hypothetical protein Y1Q_0000989 [Alligator mississippiensis]|uniref:Uncharacterized protein n=1 Tax=Alligator mississippiensis TaxID=8496 RepID=A0A151NE70_ALLMI|nr:hypothetical protein Y1Q_0000989 [Alligator mississippiensis]
MEKNFLLDTEVARFQTKTSSVTKVDAVYSSSSKSRISCLQCAESPAGQLSPTAPTFLITADCCNQKPQE